MQHRVPLKAVKIPDSKAKPAQLCKPTIPFIQTKAFSLNFLQSCQVTSSSLPRQYSILTAQSLKNSIHLKLIFAKCQLPLHIFPQSSARELPVDSGIWAVGDLNSMCVYSNCSYSFSITNTLIVLCPSSPNLILTITTLHSLARIDMVDYYEIQQATEVASLSYYALPGCYQASTPELPKATRLWRGATRSLIWGTCLPGYPVY
ncbi:hypothetical protein B0H16DRAFT_863065 [Mycena metata]|uniref:Uncharacterized protein n=1 Tax=Mycena metata TaxID=1033252 RepID=A0AAD7IVA0_9AGAR|nr:hypothetical protein B0H16DRAFT_863065 [Mycena metata]